MVDAYPQRAFAFSDSQGQLYCPSCGQDIDGLTAVAGRSFSSIDRCTDCGIELRGALKQGKYHEYERETVRELGERGEPWPIADSQS